MSVLFDGAAGSTTPSSSSGGVEASSTALAEKGSYISVLADVGHAIAFEAEGGEELDQISAGSLAVQVCLRSFHSPHTVTEKTKAFYSLVLG